MRQVACPMLSSFDQVPIVPIFVFISSFLLRLYIFFCFLSVLSFLLTPTFEGVCWMSHVAARIESCDSYQCI